MEECGRLQSPASLSVGKEPRLLTFGKRFGGPHRNPGGGNPVRGRTSRPVLSQTHCYALPVHLTRNTDIIIANMLRKPN
jgi:hypothetical protein